MEWRIRTEKRMNAAEDKTTLSGAYKLERHLPEGMRRRMSALGDNPFNGEHQYGGDGVSRFTGVVY